MYNARSWSAMRAYIDRIESTPGSGLVHTSDSIPSPYLRPHTFFGSRIHTDVRSCLCPDGWQPNCSSLMQHFNTWAVACNHRGLTGAMRGSHAAPALGGLASSAGTSQQPQVSRSTSLPVPAVERPVAARPGVWPIWVRRVTVFFHGDLSPPCVGHLAWLGQDPAVHRGSGLRA